MVILLIRSKPAIFCLSDLLSVLGSVYEISGSEVCFSTGDLIKVIGTELLSVSCEDVENNQIFELPITHTGWLQRQKKKILVHKAHSASQLSQKTICFFSGLFKVVPEEMPYSSVEEMISLRPVGLDSCLSFTFTCHKDLKLEDFTVSAGNTLTVLYIDRQHGKEDALCCRFKGQQDCTALVCIPLSVCGEFTECESEETFSLQEIISSPFLQSRRFCFANRTMSKRPLSLSPVYQVHALMNRKQNFYSLFFIILQQ